MRGISCVELPIRNNAFFEQAVLQRDLGQGFLELTRLGTQPLDLITGGFANRVTRESLLPGLQKLLRPAVIQVLVDAFLAAQLGNAVLATKAGDHNPDLVLS